MAKITGALRGPWIHSRLRFHTFPCFVACNLKIKPISNTPSAAKLGITTAVPPPRGQVRQGLCNIPIQRKTNMEPHKKMLGEFSQCFQPARSWKLPARFTTQDIQKKNRGFQPRDLSCVLKFFWEGICFFPGIIYYNQTNVIFVRTVVPSSRGLQESYNKASLIIVAFML